MKCRVYVAEIRQKMNQTKEVGLSVGFDKHCPPEEAVAITRMIRGMDGDMMLLAVGSSEKEEFFRLGRAFDLVFQPIDDPQQGVKEE